MTIEKLACPSCGAALQPKPGLSRVSCRYCGSVYSLKKSSSHASNGTGRPSVSGDNPADVLLIPIPASDISLGDVYAPVLDFGRPVEETRGRILEPKYPPFEEAMKQLDHRVRFFSMLALLNESSYQLKGRMILNIIPKYLPYESDSGQGPLSASEARQLTEPSAVYHYPQRNISNHMYPDSLKKYRGYFDLRTIYSSSAASRSRRETTENAASLLKPYGFTVSSEEKLTLPGTETYFKDGFLNNSEKRHLRVWATAYTEQLISLKITPAYAEKLLSNEEKSTLARVGQHAFLDELAAGFADMLNRGYERQLEKRISYPVRLILEEDCLGLGTVLWNESRYDVNYYPYGSSLDLTHGALGSRSFREFGMSSLTDAPLRIMAGAQLLSRILSLCESGEGAHWHVTSMDPDMEYGFSHKRLTAVTLSPAARTQAVYDSWA